MTTTTPHRNSFLSNRPPPPTKNPQSPTSTTTTTPPEPTTPPSTTHPQKPQFVPPPVNSFAFTHIPVLSLTRARTFYSTVFNWTFKPQTSDSQLIFFTPSSVMGSLSLVPGTVPAEDGSESQPEKHVGGVVNYVLVEDVVATLQRVVEAGGTVDLERLVEGGHTELGRFWDTEGNLVGVLKWLI